ncbi:MAG: arginine repressor [Actinobacteria bacterium]|uniref:Unannotated protein n=1 Tax=freshwater metagenome TaxID=449393 RepID=A0A6J7IQF2_9ZZZZ|nr:arginine repressor [Actinomycetota bacterium]MSX24697.1 arginine repressor [Actinomycetota bacterium]MSY57376.1 arginine repressor [Actinomycetota bacterium]MTB00037.1 arginine repressor [Actinomycetota bacterium]
MAKVSKVSDINGSGAAARRAKVVALVESGVVHSQSDLVILLRKAGFAVTQATASRDLEEIGAVRGHSSGESTYQLPSSSVTPLARVIAIPTQLILTVESSANLAVVRTPPGGAQLLASALDTASADGSLHSVIGTIAGDDTVLVIARKSDGGANLAKELRAIGARSVNHVRKAKG